MKKSFRLSFWSRSLSLSSWSVASIGSIALFFAACGDDVTTQVIQDNNMSIVSTSKELPKCTKDNEGEQAFVKGETAPRVCMDGKWFATSSGDKDTVLVKDTVVMKDTIVVKDTVVLKENSGCTTKELKDKSGVKIICGGDSVGVVLNGKNGEKGDKGDAGAAGKDGSNGKDGTNGKDGVGCSVASKTDSTVTVACGTDTFTMSLGGSSANPDTGNVVYEIENASISGVSQKGPFVKGAMVTAFELDGSKSLLQTGRTFVSNITQDDGRFNMSNVTLKSSYVRLSANGYYRNEVSGKNSTAPITLNAVTDLDARNTVNVNLLTHLEYDRVAQLMAKGDGTLKIKKLKKQAEGEIFKAFHFDDLADFGYSEDLDVFGKTDADAALLAISILLQGDRNEAGLTALLTGFSNDFKDGKWDSAQVKAEIADSALSKDSQNKLAIYRTNVKNWGLSTTVPGFEKYVRRFASIENGLGVCGVDEKVGTVKQVTNENSKKFYAKSYTDVSSVGGNTRFICVNADSTRWRIAENIEMDTMGWGHDFKVGEVRNGRVNTNLTYVYQDKNWRLGTNLDSLLVKVAKGKACLTVGDTSTVKYNNVYYVCTANTDGAVRGWKKASDIYNDTYEQHEECKKGKAGVYGDGTLLKGRVNTNKTYVCDNGEFREANKTNELVVNKGCSSYTLDSLTMVAGYYKCDSSGWNVSTEKFNKGTVKDARDSNEYKTIGIGTQMWMAENLNFDYKVADSTYGNTYYKVCGSFCGRYYTWAAAMDSAGVYSGNSKGCGFQKTCTVKTPARGVCPEGWHIPTQGEWKTLYSAMGSTPYAMQANGMWPDATDDYGFFAIPVGYISDNGTYSGNTEAAFWTSTEYAEYRAFTWSLQRDEAESPAAGGYKAAFVSVRCVKD